MKKMMFMAMMMTIAITANAMSYKKAKKEALFLSDKMAYELNLTNSQYDAVYEINLDYLMSVNNRSDIYGVWWNRRNADLQYVLTVWQYNKYVSLSYFYRPIFWNSGKWTFSIYNYYTNKKKFYNPRPMVYVSYKGGNNRMYDRFYADKKVSKPTPKPNNQPNWKNTGNVKHQNKPAANNRNSNGNSRFGTNRQATKPSAQKNASPAKTTGNSNSSGKFGGRR